MNLFLRPLDDPNGVTWSIIWSLIILLAGVIYYIYTILKLATEEMKDGSNDATQQEELLQLPSSGDQQSPGRGHD
jgi:hypothetical protein